MLEDRIIFILSSALIGIGLASIHIFHVSNVFEFQTGFSELSKIERYLLFAKDEYFYYYKTIVEEKNFDTGLNRVLFDNTTEYPTTINAAHRFHVVPEIFTSLLYLSFINMTDFYNLPSVWCWQESMNGSEMECLGWGDPTYFYLGIIWILSGLMVFTMFMYGTFLSKHILGGFACVIYYFTLHEHATNLHKTPSARENFALPFMLIQFFILSKDIAKRRKMGNDETQVRNFAIISDMALITTVTIIFWQMSSIIFTTQILVIYFLYETGHLGKRLVSDFTLSQIFANIFAYILTNKNSYFLTSLHFTTAISLMLHISKMQMYLQSVSNRSTAFKFRRFIRNLALLIFFSYITLDILNKIFGEYAPLNVTLSHLRLAASRLNIIPATFISFLTDTMIANGPLQYDTAKAMFNVFCVKNLCLFIIVFLGKYLQNRRERKFLEESGDTKERAKNYVIEDYMEENRVKMNDLSNPITEKEIQNCLDLLKECNYDYAKYKKQKARNALNAEKERSSFLSDIKKLKDQINEKERNRQQQQEKQGVSTTSNTTTTNNSSTNNTNIEKQDSESSKESKTPNETTKKIDDVSQEEAPTIIDPVYIYNLAQIIALGILQLFIEKLKYIFIPFACVFAATIPSKKWFSKNTHVYFMIYGVLMLCTLINPGFKNIKDQYKYKEKHNLEMIKLLKWIDTKTANDAVFGGPIDVISAVQLITKRSIINHPHIEVPEMRDRTKSIYALYSRRESMEVHNDLSTMRVDYVIVSYDLCYNILENGKRIVDYWDKIDVEHRGNPELCHELFTNSFTSFLKVYENKKYVVVRIFSENLSDFSDIKLLPSKYRSTQIH